MTILRFRRRDPAYDLPHPALLPATHWLREATKASYAAGGITREAAIDHLMNHCGMSPADAARTIADAIEVKL